MKDWSVDASVEKGISNQRCHNYIACQRSSLQEKCVQEKDDKGINVASPCAGETEMRETER